MPRNSDVLAHVKSEVFGRYKIDVYWHDKNLGFFWTACSSAQDFCCTIVAQFGYNSSQIKELQS